MPEVSQGDVVEAVNFNAPGQVVIAGHAVAVARAIEIATARCAARHGVAHECSRALIALRPAAEKLSIGSQTSGSRHIPTSGVFMSIARSHTGRMIRSGGKQLATPVLGADHAHHDRGGCDSYFRGGPGS